MIGILPIKDSLSGFSNSTIWLIIQAFFMLGGLIKTQLS